MTNKTRYIVPFIVVSILFFSVVGFSGIEEDYWPTQGWRVSTPEEQGVDSRTLAEAVNHVMEKNLNIHSILVIRNGYIVADVTFDPFKPDTKHDIASVTKSITSTLIGRVWHN